MKHTAFTYVYTHFKIHTHIYSDETQWKCTVYTINCMPTSTFPLHLTQLFKSWGINLKLYKLCITFISAIWHNHPFYAYFYRLNYTYLLATPLYHVYAFCLLGKNYFAVTHTAHYIQISYVFKPTLQCTILKLISECNLVYRISVLKGWL